MLASSISTSASVLLVAFLVGGGGPSGVVHPDWRRRYKHLAMPHKSIAKVAMGRRMGELLY